MITQQPDGALKDGGMLRGCSATGSHATNNWANEGNGASRGANTSRGREVA